MLVQVPAAIFRLQSQAIEESRHISRHTILCAPGMNHFSQSTLTNARIIHVHKITDRYLTTTTRWYAEPRFAACVWRLFRPAKYFPTGLPHKRLLSPSHCISLSQVTNHNTIHPNKLHLKPKWATPSSSSTAPT
jgi:hypothetical protein